MSGFFFFKCKTQTTITKIRHAKKQGNMVQRNKRNLLKKIETYELPDKEFKTTILKKLKYYNTGGPLNEISKKKKNACTKIRISSKR